VTLPRTYTAGDLAERFNLELYGNPNVKIKSVSVLKTAQPDQLAFLANPKYRSQLSDSHAGAVVLAAEYRNEVRHCALVSKNPYADFARIATLYETPESFISGTHPSCNIASDAQVHPTAMLGAFCSIGARSQIGAYARLEAGCLVGEDCVVGEHTKLNARVTLVKKVIIGKRTIIHSGAVIGADGFGMAWDDNQWIKVPQLGGVIIGDDCDIGANTTIDCGALENTVLEDDVKLDNQVQIGHNVRIGAHTAIAGCTAIAGSAQIGRNCLIAGGVGIVGHIHICDRVTITAMSLVSNHIRKPGSYSSGTSLQETKLWRKNTVLFRRLAQSNTSKNLSKSMQDPVQDG
jgi:UDP-3-O-[3-hydroxymyristoyl] glucosamine N-acyltransferase